MRDVVAMASLVALLVGGVGCEQGTGRKDDFAPLGTSNDAAAVTIVGAGTVTFNNAPGIANCAGDGSVTTHCDPVRWDGGNGSVTATAATGWRFDGWSLTYGAASNNSITDPKAPTQTVVPGTAVALTATFVPLIHPIQATFTQATFSTAYELVVDNPDLDIIKVVWSGPNCGTFDPKEGLGAESRTVFGMTWSHPHDPRLPNMCDATTDHKNITITATVTIKDKTFVVTYQGADTGVGGPPK